MIYKNTDVEDYKAYLDTMNKNAEIETSGKTAAANGNIKSFNQLNAEIAGRRGVTATPAVTYSGVEQKLPEYTPNTQKATTDANSQTAVNSGGEDTTGQNTGTGAYREDGLLSESDWSAQNISSDPDSDYLESKAALDAEYRKSLATYGQNAEKLYQMGLSGSGVSDIYGADAYSSYIDNAVKLKQTQLQAKANNKAAYLAYADSYRTSQDSTAATYAANLIDNGTYTGDNEESIRATLAAQGLSSSMIDEVMSRTKSVFDKQVADGTISTDRVKNAYASLASSYESTDNDSQVKTDLKVSGYTDEEISQVLELLHERVGAVVDDDGNIVKTSQAADATDSQTVLGLSQVIYGEDGDELNNADTVRLNYSDVYGSDNVEAAIVKAGENLATKVDESISEGSAEPAELLSTLDTYVSRKYIDKDGEQYNTIKQKIQAYASDYYSNALDTAADDDARSTALSAATAAWQAGALDDDGLYTVYAKEVEAGLNQIADGSADTGVRSLASEIMFIDNLVTADSINENVAEKLKQSIYEKCDVSVSIEGTPGKNALEFYGAIFITIDSNKYPLSIMATGREEKSVSDSAVKICENDGCALYKDGSNLYLSRNGYTYKLDKSNYGIQNYKQTYSLTGDIKDAIPEMLADIANPQGYDKTTNAEKILDGIKNKYGISTDTSTSPYRTKKNFDSNAREA